MNLAAKPPATLSAADRSHAMADIKAKGFEEFTAFALLRDHNGDVVKAKQAADDSLHLESLGLTRGDAIRLLKKHKWNRRAAVAEREAINKAAEKALQDKARQKAIIRIGNYATSAGDMAQQLAKDCDVSDLKRATEALAQPANAKHVAIGFLLTESRHPPVDRRTIQQRKQSPLTTRWFISACQLKCGKSAQIYAFQLLSQLDHEILEKEVVALEQERVHAAQRGLPPHQMTAEAKIQQFMYNWLFEHSDFEYRMEHRMDDGYKRVIFRQICALVDASPKDRAQALLKQSINIACHRAVTAGDYEKMVARTANEGAMQSLEHILGWFWYRIQLQEEKEEEYLRANTEAHINQMSPQQWEEHEKDLQELETLRAANLYKRAR